VEAGQAPPEGCGRHRKIETGTASAHDSRHFESVLDPNNTNRDVLADKGYTSVEREAKLKQTGGT
jgi:IS5 family transposase